MVPNSKSLQICFGFVFVYAITAYIVHVSWQANKKGIDNIVHWFTLSAKGVVYVTVFSAGLW